HQPKKATAFFQNKKLSPTTKKTPKPSHTTYPLLLNQPTHHTKLNKPPPYLKPQNLTTTITTPKRQPLTKPYTLITTPLYD
ncbi:hypothetical protein, partial [Bacillus altitudinis]|uniref:hypothetical protein n=1 Tax=Bacillus altitudinis TaxID=293387 RepID=UPI001C92C7E0